MKAFFANHGLRVSGARAMRQRPNRALSICLSRDTDCHPGVHGRLSTRKTPLKKRHFEAARDGTNLVY
jgi:hypothetical protein